MEKQTSRFAGRTTLLTSQYTEISSKYKLLIQNLDNQWNKIHEEKIHQLDTLNTVYNARLEEARKENQNQTEALYQEYENLSQKLHPLKAEKQTKLAKWIIVFVHAAKKSSSKRNKRN